VKEQEQMPEAKTTNETTTTPVPTVRYAKPEGGVPLFYSNHFLIGNTVFDLRIVFGEVTDVIAGSVEITNRAHVSMSWLEAKALAEALTVYVKDYEAKNGPIKTEFHPITTPAMPQIPYILPPEKSAR
jgi:hypothetical protein